MGEVTKGGQRRKILPPGYRVIHCVVTELAWRRWKSLCAMEALTMGQSLEYAIAKLSQSDERLAKITTASMEVKEEEV